MFMLALHYTHRQLHRRGGSSEGYFVTRETVYGGLVKDALLLGKWSVAETGAGQTEKREAGKVVARMAISECRLPLWSGMRDFSSCVRNGDVYLKGG